MAEPLTPTIIVLALGAGALGFPDALRLLLLHVAGRSPVLDIAICAFAMAVLTAYALGAVLLVRFVLKAGPGAGGHMPAPRARRTDPLARLTLAVALGASGLVFACLIAEPGARGLALLCRVLGDVAGEIPVVSVLVASAGAGAVLACTTRRQPLLRASPASTPTARLSVTAQLAAAAAAAFLVVVVVVVSGCLYARRGSSLVAVAAAVVGASMILTRNAADAGGHAALGPATNTRRFQAPSQLVASVVCLLLVVVATTKMDDIILASTSSMAGLVRRTIVLALGAAVLGAPDALRLLLGLDGRGPAADLTACFVLISAVTAHVLGTVLLSLFVRKAPRARGGAQAVPSPAMDLFAQVTGVVSVGAALLVTACHLLASGGGGGWVRAVGELGAKNPAVAALVVILGAACSLRFPMPLLRFVRRTRRNATGAGGGAAAPAAWADTRRVGKMTSLGVVLVSLACLVLLAIAIPSWREVDIGEQTCSAAA